MPIDRSTIVLGPGSIAHDGAIYFSEDPIVVSITKEFFDVRLDAFDVVLKALTDVTIEVTATPKEWGNHSKMNPFLSMAHGTLINGGTDKPLVITPINGQPLTAAAAAVMRPPGLICSANKAPLGQMTWTCVLANNTAWTATGARLSHGAGATGVALTGFDKSKAGLSTWTPVYNSTTLNTQDGTTVDWNVRLQPVPSDSDGTVDYSFDGIEAVARMLPMGITAEAYVTMLGIQGLGVTRGASSTTADLVITGSGGRSVTLKNATPRAGQQRFGRSVQRLGQLEFVSVRDINAGSLSPIAILA